MNFLRQPPKQFEGALGEEFKKLWGALRALRFVSSSGQTADITTNGTVVRQRSRQTTGEIVEAEVFSEADDYLGIALDGASDITDYALKPFELRASRWNPGWQPGAPVAVGNGNFAFTYGYLSERERRVVFDNSAVLTPGDHLIQNVLRTLQPNTDDFPGGDWDRFYAGVYWWSVRQVISPFYSTRSGSPPQTSPLPAEAGAGSRIWVMKMQEPVTVGDVDCAYVDLNFDARHWGSVLETKLLPGLVYDGFGGFFQFPLTIELFDSAGNPVIHS